MLWRNRNKKVGLCAMVVMTSLVLVGIWAVLATPEAALAKKPGDGGGVLNGSATFRDAVDPLDRVSSDGGGPYYDSANGRKGDTILDLGDAFFRLQVKKNLRKNEGRWFDLDFENLQVVDSEGNPIPFDPEIFKPENPYVWSLHVQGTLQDWRAQELNVPVLRDGDIYFGNNGNDEAHINYGAGSSWDGDQLTVTRIGDDVWTIESFDTDKAQLRRQGESFGFTPMPFNIDYDGTATP